MTRTRKRNEETTSPDTDEQRFVAEYGLDELGGGTDDGGKGGKEFTSYDLGEGGEVYLYEDKTWKHYNFDEDGLLPLGKGKGLRSLGKYLEKRGLVAKKERSPGCSRVLSGSQVRSDTMATKVAKTGEKKAAKKSAKKAAPKKAAKKTAEPRAKKGEGAEGLECKWVIPMISFLKKQKDGATFQQIKDGIGAPDIPKSALNSAFVQPQQYEGTRAYTYVLTAAGRKRAASL